MYPRISVKKSNASALALKKRIENSVQKVKQEEGQKLLAGVLIKHLKRGTAQVSLLKDKSLLVEKEGESFLMHEKDGVHMARRLSDKTAKKLIDRLG